MNLGDITGYGVEGGGYGVVSHKGIEYGVVSHEGIMTSVTPACTYITCINVIIKNFIIPQ